MLRKDTFDPFNYLVEVYQRLLWISESDAIWLAVRHFPEMEDSVQDFWAAKFVGGRNPWGRKGKPKES